MEFVNEGHLGGYIAGGDPATIFPDMWTWLVKEHGVKSVLDIGCGEGHSLKFFRELGCRVMGIEGLPQPDPDIVSIDFAKKGNGQRVWEEAALYQDWDLAWMCEFVEHIEEKYISNVVPFLQRAKLILMTHASPGQAGHHHVNCRDAEYWKGFMNAAGFVFDEKMTAITRDLAARNKNPYNHYLRSGMTFSRV